MPAAAPLTSAELREIVLATADRPAEETNPDATVTVQFNPESLRVSLQNTSRGAEQPGGSAVQHVARGSTRLSVTLWFDVTVDPDRTDVREVTKRVAYFLQPQGESGAPPGIRFVWGSFLFEGVVDSMEETLEFFSPDGYPLRSQVALTLSAPEIQFRFDDRHRPATPGAQPTTPIRAGESLQQAAVRAGAAVSAWRDVAAALDIDNPRFPGTGTPLRLPGRP
jgi:hypothetical protein